MEEHSHIERGKIVVRQYARDNGWRRCGRSKKHETYKKTVNGVIQRLKFGISAVSYGEYVRGRYGSRNTWAHLYTQLFIDIRTFDNLDFIRTDGGQPVREMTSVEESADERDYLHRLGIL